ncbi:hypothetical protein [Neobacillus sp. FSL H8-0543]|uniref:hypothetical protein n=1 Tax=Neobacillus sp. FSL H8-0543 TaxID=2954672 RepID=UPI0031599049
MKINPIVLIIVVGMALYVGFNTGEFDNEKSTNSVTTKASKGESNSNTKVVEVSNEVKQERFNDFYSKIYEFVDNFEKIDSTIAQLDGKNVSRLQTYELFKKLKDAMEEGQKLPISRLVPEGFSPSQEETFTAITRELDHTFQYRKFAYEHYMEYVDNNSIKDADKSKEWLLSAQSSLQSVITNLEALKIELNASAEEKPPAESKEKTDGNVEYDIVYSYKQRADGGISYYVLIDPVDIKSASFNDKVKQIIEKLVEEKGKKISVEIFDDEKALELTYKQYGDLSLDRPLNESENNLKAIHYIAAYSGDLKTGLFLNTLYYFPSAFSDTAQVGKYVETLEFNPE